MRQRGFALATVVILLALVGAAVFALTRDATLGRDRVERTHDGAVARYAAEAGLAHAMWVANNSGCKSYDLPTTAFGTHSYTAIFTPNADSPVTIAAKGVSADGASANLFRQRVSVFESTQQVTTLQLGKSVGKDAILDDFYSSRNYGGADYLQINSAPAWLQRPVLEFDMSGIPQGAKVISAQLELRLGNMGTPGYAAVHRMTRSWVEGTKTGGGIADGATWQTFDGTNPWLQPGGDFDPTPYGVSAITAASIGQWVAWDVGELVTAWVTGIMPNFGLMLAGDGVVTGANFASQESTTPLDAPKLTIVYACECGQVCVADPNAPYAHWKLDDGAGPTALDSVGSHDGTLVSNPTWVAGRLDGALDFDGVDDFVDAGTFDVAGSGLTMMGWFNAETIPTSDGRIVSKADGPNDFNAWWQLSTTDVGSNRYIRMRIKAGGTTTTLADSSVNLATGQWYFAVATYDNSGAMKLYLDGTEVASGMHAVGGPVDLAPTVPVAIGANGTAERFFDGILDDVRVYSRALSATEIADLVVEAGTPLPGPLLFVVPNAASLSSQDSARKALIESWGYTVTNISANASQANYNTALAAVDVVYISELVSSTDVGTKLTDTTVGVVSEEWGLVDELGIAQQTLIQKNTTNFQIIDNTHYVTSGFSLGALALYSSAQSIWIVSGPLAPGLQLLGETQDTPSVFLPGLAVLDTSAELYGGGFAAGRRVQLPWAGGATFDINALTDNGRTIMKRAIEWGTGGGGGGAGGGGGPIAHWMLDDGTGLTAVDSVDGHHGTLTSSGPVWVAGQLGDALDFDGVDDYVDLTSDAELDDVFVGGATVMAWIEPTSWGGNGYGRVFDKSSVAASTGDGWAIRLNKDNGGLNFGQGFTSGRGWWRFAASSINFNTWQHIALAYDASSTANDPIVYLNGSPVAVTRVDTPSGAVRSDAAINLRLGSHASVAFNVFDGKIDDARIYDRMLSAAEIVDIAAGGGGGTFRDEFNTVGSYTGDDGTLSWSTNWLEINESDGAGSGDEVVLSGAPGTVARVQDNDSGGEGLQREADLSGHSTATLTFIYWRGGLDDASDYITIDASVDNWVTWTEVGRIEGPGTDSTPQSASYDISAYIAPNTRIRFLTSPNMGVSDKVYFDNVQIEVSN